MDTVKLAQAYALLTALKANLPKNYTIEQKYVDQFHSVLNTLEKESGHKLDDFRIPSSELRRRTVMSNSLTDEKVYSETPECDRDFLLLKLDAVLTFFSIQEGGKTIGFAG